MCCRCASARSSDRSSVAGTPSATSAPYRSLQAVEVGVAVAPVAGVAALARREQADLVVVVQGAHRDPGETGDLAHWMTHLGSLLRTPLRLVPHVA